MKTYWHFAAINADGRPVMRDRTPIEIGKRYEGPEAKLCTYGYHGSSNALDALGYAPGPWVSRRPLENVIRGGDKVVGTAFVQQPGIDATEILRKFARMCALDVVHLWDAPQVVMDYLKTGDESIRTTARDAARDAATAAWYAAWYATRDAAEAVAMSAAAEAAARDAAEDATRAASEAVAMSSTDAARDAAYAGFREKQSRRLSRILIEALQEADDD